MELNALQESVYIANRRMKCCVLYKNFAVLHIYSNIRIKLKLKSFLKVHALKSSIFNQAYLRLSCKHRARGRYVWSHLVSRYAKAWPHFIPSSPWGNVLDFTMASHQFSLEFHVHSWNKATCKYLKGPFGSYFILFVLSLSRSARLAVDSETLNLTWLILQQLLTLNMTVNHWISQKWVFEGVTHSAWPMMFTATTVGDFPAFAGAKRDISCPVWALKAWN